MAQAPQTRPTAHHSLPLGRIMGIQIGIDYSWFLIFGLLTWMLARGYFPAEFKHWPDWLYWLLGAATSILLFVSVLLHELGHSAVALRYKVPVRSITLFLFGGVSQIEAEPPGPRAEFLIAIAGPAVSLALAGIFYLIKPAFTGTQAIFALVQYLAYINLALAIFNLIPGYPLDGGRVFRAIVWGITKNMKRATIIAANTGRGFGFLFIFIGILMMFHGDFGNGIWVAFIGWYLDSAASAEVRQAQFKGMLAGHTVRQAMEQAGRAIPADLTLQQLVDEHILGAGRRAFLVEDGTKNVGLITLHGLRKVPRENWQETTVRDAMITMSDVKRTEPGAELWAALEEMERDGVNQLPVMTDSQVVGMLSRDDVITFLGTVRELRS